jgi:ABC-2 type transport system permease protein
LRDRDDAGGRDDSRREAGPTARRATGEDAFCSGSRPLRTDGGSDGERAASRTDGGGAAAPGSGTGSEADGRGLSWAVRVRGVVAKRDLSSLTREKTIVLALAIQLFVAAFSSFLVVGLTSLYDPSAVQGQVQVGVTGDAADELVVATAGLEGFEAVRYRDAGEAQAAFEANGVDALVVADRYQTEGGGSRIDIRATAPANSFRGTLIVAQLRESLEALERQQREERTAFLDAPLVPLPDEVPASPYFGFSYTVLVPLLLFLPVFIAGSVAVDTVTEEIERGTLELLQVAPLSLTAIADGKALAAVLLGPLQALLWMTLLSLNGIQIGNLLGLLVMTAGLSLALVGVGIGLALVVRERQRAQLLYSLGTLGTFAAAAVLPEHPATTAALLAIDSPGPLSRLLVVLYLVAGLAVALGIRSFVSRVDAEGL